MYDWQLLSFRLGKAIVHCSRCSWRCHDPFWLRNNVDYVLILRQRQWARAEGKGLDYDERLLPCWEAHELRRFPIPCTSAWRPGSCALGKETEVARYTLVRMMQAWPATWLHWHWTISGAERGTPRASDLIRWSDKIFHSTQIPRLTWPADFGDCENVSSYLKLESLGHGI